jgi:hypothetical protein
MGAHTADDCKYDRLSSGRHHAGVHASFLHLERSLVSLCLSLIDQTQIRKFHKARYSKIYSPVHILAFYIDPLFVRSHLASKASKLKPMDGTDASACMAAAQRICRDAAAAEMARVTSEILMVTAEQYPVLKWSTVHRSAATCLPGPWWNTNGP